MFTCSICSNHQRFLPGYSVTTLKDGRTQYFVAGAPRSNHTGQVIVYTLNTQKQTTVIDSERGKQVLAREKAGPYFSFHMLSGRVVLLDWVLLWECPLLSGCGQRWSNRPPAGRGTNVHERVEERGRQGVRLLRHQGNRVSEEQCWFAMLVTLSLQLYYTLTYDLLFEGHLEWAGIPQRLLANWERAFWDGYLSYPRPGFRRVHWCCSWSAARGQPKRCNLHLQWGEEDIK